MDKGCNLKPVLTLVCAIAFVTLVFVDFYLKAEFFPKWFRGCAIVLTAIMGLSAIL